jgi:hypothetical protein
VTRKETLEEAYRIAKRNGGAAGIDGQTFEAIETCAFSDFAFQRRHITLPKNLVG